MPTHEANDTTVGGVNIFLQSKDGVKYDNNSNCDFFLGKIVDAPRQDLSMLVSVLDAEIPYSWYNISEHLGNNKITINDIEITITEKNYSAFSLATALTAELFSHFIGDAVIIVTFDDDTNKFTFLSASVFTINKTTMPKELGAYNLPYTNTLYISTQCCDLAGTSSVYIQSDNMSIQNLSSSNKQTGILGKVIVNSPPGSYIFYQPSTPQYFVLSNALSYININLVDDDNNYIDLNGLNWSLTLSVEYFRKRTDTINYKYFLDGGVGSGKPKPIEPPDPQEPQEPPKPLN